MFNLLVKELESHYEETAYLANNTDDGIPHYYISKEFPMLGGFDAAITRRLRDLEAHTGLTSGSPVAYVKLKLRDDKCAIYMGVYFSDVGERPIVLGPSDFPKLPKDEGQE